jgi:hypothetical protein
MWTTLNSVFDFVGTVLPDLFFVAVVVLAFRHGYKRVAVCLVGAVVAVSAQVVRRLAYEVNAVPNNGSFEPNIDQSGVLFFLYNYGVVLGYALIALGIIVFALCQNKGSAR